MIVTFLASSNRSFKNPFSSSFSMTPLQSWISTSYPNKQWDMITNSVIKCEGVGYIILCQFITALKLQKWNLSSNVILKVISTLMKVRLKICQLLYKICIRYFFSFIVKETKYPTFKALKFTNPATKWVCPSTKSMYQSTVWYSIVFW